MAEGRQEDHVHQFSEEIKALVRGANFAHLATLMRDGSPQVAPVWVDLDGDTILVCTGEDVHGKTIATGSSYDNRFISVVTIEGRKIVHWRDYMDSLAAITALSQAQ